MKDNDRTLWLPQYFYSCPKFWQNFAIFVNPNDPNIFYVSTESTEDKFTRILRQDHNASYSESRSEGGLRPVIFDTVSDFWAFRTRWE
jgi:hypothetical protein